MSERANIDLPIIRFKDIVEFLTRYFKLFVFGGILLGVVGYLFSYTFPVMFSAKTILLPEYKIEGGRSSFFSMAIGGNSGFDGAEKLAPDLYPKVLSSVPFGEFLLKQPITDMNGRTYASYREYFELNVGKPSFLSKVKTWILGAKKTGEEKPPLQLQDKDILILSPQELGLINRAMAPVICNVEAKSGGTITIEAELQDPIISAQIVEYSKKYLVEYVEDYRTSKVMDQTAFLEKRTLEAKKNLRDAEFALQGYRDRHRDSYLNIARIQEQALQSEYTLAQTIYNDLVYKLEQAKIKEKEEKPVFKVLEPTKIPLAPSGPNRKSIGLIGAVIGVVLALCYALFYKEKLHLKLLQFA